MVEDVDHHHAVGDGARRLPYCAMSLGQVFTPEDTCFIRAW
jgi:hypothetical protein